MTDQATRLRFSLAALAAALLGTVQLGCEEIPAPSVISCPDQIEFSDVSPVLEKRCGTLDCHSTLARPLRIYGNGGLRLASPEEINDFEAAQASGNVSGGQLPTTPEEVEANYRSVCGLEPEKMAEVVSGEADPLELILLSKPIGPEIEGGTTHKGGAVFIKGGVGFGCLESWLLGEVIPEDCDEATSSL